MLDFNNKKDRDLFADRIKKARKKRAITQQTLADMIGVNRVTVTQWEKGNNLPDYGILSKLCEALEIDYCYLFGEYVESKYTFHEMSEYLGLSEQVLKNISERDNEFQDFLTWCLIDNQSFHALLASFYLLQDNYIALGQFIKYPMITPDDKELFNNFYTELQTHYLSANRRFSNLLIEFNKKCAERYNVPFSCIKDLL